MIHSPSPSTPLPLAGEGSHFLNGLGVLVTRPEHQAGPLCQLIERHGGVAIRCPALVIREPHDWAPALAIFDRLAEYDLAIFTSANAVDRALPRIRERGGLPPGWKSPPSARRRRGRWPVMASPAACNPKQTSPAKHC